MAATSNLEQAALGCRAHSGWAALVAIGGALHSPEVLDRRRIPLKQPGTPKQPFHAAEGLPLDRAAKIIKRSTSEARLLARRGLREVARELRAKRFSLVGCGILMASGRPLPDLAATLASHALIHSAEGELFRSALIRAARSCTLPTTQIRERDLFESAVAELRISSVKIQALLAEMGRALGPPWTQDEKFATLAAWIALAAR